MYLDSLIFSHASGDAIKGLKMITVKYGDINLECEYDFEDADDTVGYLGGVQLYGAWIGEHNIFEMLSDKTIKFIEELIWEKM